MNTPRNTAKNICPCCEEHEYELPRWSHDICSVCGWEDDGVQYRNPNRKPGANALSLNESKAAWKEKRRAR